MNANSELMSDDQLLSSYDYHLPPQLIAQTPVVPRDSSKLLVVKNATSHSHSRFNQLPHWLQQGDLIVLNNTRVMAARLYGRKSTGAEVEVLLLEPRQHNYWLALVKPGKRFKLGTKIWFESRTNSVEPIVAEVVEIDEATGGRVLKFALPPGQSLLQCLDHFGIVPLPPYITDTQAHPEQYQTVYAKQLGSVAAPTAGLHFTPQLFERLAQAGINCASITLHVGLGTFRPVETENILNHQMHQEWLEIPASTVRQIHQTKAAGGRVIAVGTTVTRALEAAAESISSLKSYQGKTDLFIYPGYRWQVVDGLITNFHLPRSSLLMLVSAMIGRQRLLALYENAIANQYRFYSFGDAMLILPEARLQ